MKPNDPNRRDLLVEQWWVGCGVMVFWAVVVMVLCQTCSGREVKISWVENSPDQFVTGYKLWRDGVVIADVQGPPATIEANDGDQIRISAYNGWSESLQSAPLIIGPVKGTVPTKRVTLQQSKDLTTWENLSEFDIDASQEAKFFRMKIE